MRLSSLIQKQQSAKTLRERIDATLSLAIFYSDQADYKEAIVEYKSLLTLYKGSATTDKLQLALAHRSMAECYLELGDFNNAIKNASHYLKSAKELNNTLEQQRALVTIGRCFQCRADNVFNGKIARRSLLAAKQAILNSIKITAELSDLTACQIAEMKAVSLLNLGHVLRSCGDFESARSRFDQCINISRKYSLTKLLFRATFQQSELPLFQWPSLTQSRCRPSDLLTYTEADSVLQALNLCTQTLKFYCTQQCIDKETRILRRNLEELLAQLFVGKGRYRMAAKVYRQLSRADPEAGLNYKLLCGKCLRLESITNRVQVSPCEDVEEIKHVSEYYEKLGDILSSMDQHGPAFRCYQQMLVWAESAYYKQREIASGNDDMERLASLAKQVDSGLVSAAEACASLGAHIMCAHFYRREIIFNHSLIGYCHPGFATLGDEELAQSWLSIARALIQAPKNMPSEFLLPDCDSLPGSKTPEEALQNALSKARTSKNLNILRDCLDELAEFYKSSGQETQAEPYYDELNALAGRIDGETGEPSVSTPSPCRERSKEGDSIVDLDSQSEAREEAIEVLSSDSDVEKCISIIDGATDLIESPVKRRNKALCLKTNLKGESPLHVAVINGNLEHVVKLVEVMAHPINIRDGAGWLPIHEAAFHDHDEIATYLLDKGALLDDVGCKEDLSTPLFEAIHGGSLKTAIILANRGADLWHVNCQGETLSDLLNDWQPKKAAFGGSESQRLLFNQLLHTIKEKLGDSYERWYSYRPPKPVVDSSAQAKGSVTIVDDEEDEDDATEMDNESPPVTKTRKLASLRRRTISSDSQEEEQETLKTYEKKKRSLIKRIAPDCNSVAIQDYRNAMKAVGSSASRYSKTHHMNSGKHGNKIRLSTSSHGCADNSDEGQREKDGREPQQKRRRRKNRDFPSPIYPRNSPSRFDTSSAEFERPNVLHPSEPLEFDSSEVFSSTQAEPLVTFQTSKPPASSLLPTRIPPAPLAMPSQKTDLSEQSRMPGMTWCTVKVTFHDISLVVPVDSSSRTVKWLAKEAYRRHQLLLNQEASAVSANQIRIRTSDGALLLPTDLLCTVLPAAATPHTLTPELIAEVIETMKSPQVPSTASSSNKSVHEFPGLLQNLNHLSSSLRRAIVGAVETGCLDLSFQALGARGCADALTHYIKMRPASRPLKKLHLNGNMLSSMDLLEEPASPGKPDLLAVFQEILTPNLKELSLSENFLTLEGVLALLCSKQEGCDTQTNHLTHLCLNYNPLFCQMKKTTVDEVAEGGLDSPSILPTAWLTVESFDVDSEGGAPPLLSRVLAVCPHLTCLQLVGCDITSTVWQAATMSLSDNTIPSSGEPCEANSPNPTFANLVELDLSLNPLSSGLTSTDNDFLFNLLKPPERIDRPDFSTLRVLRIRGSFSRNAKSCANSEPFLGPDPLSEESWFLCENITERLDLGLHGDAFISCLARFLDSGNSKIQMLDVRCCNLTERCLINFQRLLAAPCTALKSLLCSENPCLQKPALWAKLLSTSAQATSSLTSLSIDVPLLETDADLILVTEAVSSKMSLVACPAPLQEFALATPTPFPLLGDHFPLRKKISLSTLMSVREHPLSPSAPPLVRFIFHVVACFLKSFGKLAKVYYRPCCIVFSSR